MVSIFQVGVKTKINALSKFKNLIKLQWSKCCDIGIKDRWVNQRKGIESLEMNNWCLLKCQDHIFQQQIINIHTEKISIQKKMKLNPCVTLQED